ncbi:hypothetical protein PV326_003878 [Microctonus aethiopoides]|nr:hypothetical protein PV326_003878 [Microctonus aethiopoides]
MNLPVPLRFDRSPIKIEMCRGLGYNVTAMPNFVGHEIQSDAEFTLQTFSPLIQYGCSAQLHLFLCSVYAPMCTEKVSSPIGPCRGLCEQVRARCSPILQGFGFPWPTALNCSKFPPKNNHQHMCMEGPGEPGPINSVQTAGTGNGPWSCSEYANAGKYIFLNRSGKCAAICDADILWSHREKRLVDAWMAVFVTICLVSFVAGILTLLKAKKHRGSMSTGESALAYLVMCHAAVGMGYIVRLAAGRLAVTCTPVISLNPQDQVVIVQQQDHQTQTHQEQLQLHHDYQHHQEQHLHHQQPQQLQHYYLTHDGLTNPYCTIVFLLLYYFGSAASVWWVVLCTWWCIAARKWNRSTGCNFSKNNDDGFGSQYCFSILGAIAAWSFPAVHTVIVLITRDVDADELMGNCFVGQQNTRSLLLLVLTPQCVYLFTGMIFLIFGIVPFLRQSRQLTTTLSPILNTIHPMNPLVTRREATSFAKLHKKQRIILIRFGVFAYFYAMAMICITSVTFYEWWGRDSWLKAREPSSIPRIPSRPQFYLFILKLVVFLSAGATAAGWIWFPNLIRIWKKMPLPYSNKDSGNHKYHPHALIPVIHSCQTNASVRPVTFCQIHHHHHLSSDLTGSSSIAEQQHYSMVSGTENSPRRSHKSRRKSARKYRSGSETQV